MTEWLYAQWHCCRVTVTVYTLTATDRLWLRTLGLAVETFAPGCEEAAKAEGDHAALAEACASAVKRLVSDFIRCASS